MRQFFLIIYRYKAFLVFVFLELLCLWLVVQNNSYQGAVAFSTAREIVADTYEASNNLSDYISLKEVNGKLARENASLYTRLQENTCLDAPALDSTVTKQYEYVAAKVINNSTLNNNNYLTIDKGSKDGIKKGMGVITTEGVVGKVKSCSEHFSVVYSVLHAEMMVSSQIKRNKVIGFTKWNQKDYTKANVLYIGRHVLVKPGDTVVTTGYNATYPENCMVGIVRDVRKREENIHLDIDIDLSTDFSRLSYVYVIKNRLKPELDSLQRAAIPEKELKSSDPVLQ